MLSETNEIFWLGETGADFQFSASILAKGPSELERILDGIAVKLGPILREKSVSICHSFYLLSLPAAKKPLSISSLWYGDTGEVTELDSIDQKILRNVSRFPSASVGECARKVGIPATTADYRLKNLRKRQILVGFHYLTEYQPLGWAHFPVALYLRRSTPEIKQKILKYSIASGTISYVAFLLGRLDAELGVRVSHPREISAIIEELGALLGSSLNRVQIYPDFKYHKLEYFPFDSVS